MRLLNSLYLVDDDETYQFIAQRVIEETQLVQTIKVFSNGRDAIQSIRQDLDAPNRLPDVILLDLTMPVLDGWGFLEDFAVIRPRHGKKIWIYVVSSSINPVDVERARSISDVTDYVVKPITTTKFAELIRQQ